MASGNSISSIDGASMKKPSAHLLSTIAERMILALFAIAGLGVGAMVALLAVVAGDVR